MAFIEYTGFTASVKLRFLVKNLVHDECKEIHDLLSNLLSRVPFIEEQAWEVSFPMGMEPTAPRLDVVGWVKVRKKKYTLVVEYKQQAEPRQVRMQIEQLRHLMRQVGNEHPTYGIVAASWLSDQSKHICLQHGVGYMDLTGACHLSFDQVFIEHSGTPNPRPEKRSLKSLFSPKASRILKVMLERPEHPWKVTELTERAQVSLGQVSKVRKLLLEQEFAREAEGSGLLLTDRQRLLQDWQPQYPPPDLNRRIKGYTLLSGAKLEAALKEVMDRTLEGSVVLSSYSAATLIAPYARHPTTFLYATPGGLEHLKEVLQLRTFDRGENVIVDVIESDDHTFDFQMSSGGLIHTSPLQTFLDLSVAGERGREAAEHLKPHVLKENHD